MSTEFYCEEFPTEQNGKPVQEKAKVSCAHLGRHICPQCGQFGAFAQGLLRGQK